MPPKSTMPNVKEHAVGSEALGRDVNAGDKVHMEFSAAPGGKKHNKARGTITAADITVGERTADGGHAIETVFARRKREKHWLRRLYEYCHDSIEDVYARHFLLQPIDEDDDEEERAEYARIQRNRQMLLAAFLTLLALLLLLLITPRRVREERVAALLATAGMPFAGGAEYLTAMRGNVGKAIPVSMPTMPTLSRSPPTHYTYVPVRSVVSVELLDSLLWRDSMNWGDVAVGAPDDYVIWLE